MDRALLRSIKRTARPSAGPSARLALPLPPLLAAARPRPTRSPARSYASAACPPLAHPTRPLAPVQGSSSSKAYGQPLPSTHPHLLAPGQLTPGISATEYEQRRRNLVDRLEDEAVVVIAGGKTVYSTQNILCVSLSLFLLRLALPLASGLD